MAELDKGKPVSLHEPILANLAQTDAITKLLIEKGVITDAEFKQKAAGGACGVSADFEAHGTVITEALRSIGQVEVIVFRSLLF
jgi:hypothetical protein